MLFISPSARQELFQNAGIGVFIRVSISLYGQNKQPLRILMGTSTGWNSWFVNDVLYGPAIFLNGE